MKQAREAVSLAFATALGETALQALMISDWSNPGAHALLFAFLAGPPLFLALLAWRRRERVRYSRVLFAVAAVVAVAGLGVLSFNLYRFCTDAQFRKTPDMSGVVVPLVQWGAVMAVWAWLLIEESREKRLARQSGQLAQAAGHSNWPKPPQSA